ncbi:uncharacterized protein LOC127719918 [Mytilus californianus]|uniref:uncharacterized protein LOC127719918 n=1 Tax=Mytilus californianus TaxID=6549 RepID=UPI0022479372|nr:uncharacterized protein LOC127719918 [Mytilus californianus]
MIEKHVQHLSGVAIFLCCVLQCNAVGTRDRLYSNGTSTKCMGIQCPKNHIFKPCTEGDGLRDSCEPCPSDRPVCIESFDSSKFSDPPVLFVCKNPTEECTCKSDEAEVINQAECYETLKPICQCKTEAGYFGTNPDLCELTKVENCPPGYYLSLKNGVCRPCGHSMYKDTIGFEECIPQPECKSTEVVLFNGNSTKRRTCRSTIDKVTTPELLYQNMTTQGLTKDGQNVSSVPQPTGYNETTTTKQQKEDSPLLTKQHIIILSVVLPLVVMILVLVVICWYCRRTKTKKRIYNYLHDVDPEDQKDKSCTFNQENSGYLGNSERNISDDMNKPSMKHDFGMKCENKVTSPDNFRDKESRFNAAKQDRSCQYCAEINDPLSQICEFSATDNVRHHDSRTYSDCSDSDRTIDTVEEDLHNQAPVFNSRHLGERYEPDGQEAETITKKETKLDEVNHETFPMCKEDKSQVKKAEGNPMCKDLESLLESAPQSSNPPTLSIGLQRTHPIMNNQHPLIQINSTVHPDSGLGTQLPSAGMAELNNQPNLSLSTFEDN